ncbi:hypothetical protein UFOVP399_34 [uncultured Caudovirales phage]|uniref:Uncharacterized protein n=1 Tax=uncultured Caudovirales phage TaxID=2100421 RepID=A0A6J5M719_9CAUD|nr:hypothetical protein UFOVP399_34 [uncultured Caudovirales phage]
MSKGKTKSSSRTSTTQTLNPWSQQQYTDQNTRIRGLMDSTPVTPYSGRTNADFGGVADTYMNPYEQSVIDTTMADITRMNEGQNAALRGRAAASGAYGGSGVHVGQALNNEAAQREMARTGSQLRYQGYNDARGLFAQDNSNDYNEFLRQQEERQRRIQTEMGLLGTIPMLTNSTGTSQNTQSTNPGLMGTLGQGLGLASMFVPGGGLSSMFLRGAGAAAHAGSAGSNRRPGG